MGRCAQFALAGRKEEEGGAERDNMDLKMLISFLSKLEKLKCITRHSWTSDGRKESVAEHSWRLAALVYLLKDELKNCDFDKMISMALFHDISEIKFGDIPGFDKTENDIEKEKIALEEISKEYEFLGISKVISSVKEFDEKRTEEARIVNAIDKIEGLIQHNEAHINTWIDKEYQLNLTYGIEECKVVKILSDLRNIVKEISEKKIEERKAPPRE